MHTIYLLADFVVTACIALVAAMSASYWSTTYATRTWYWPFVATFWGAFVVSIVLWLAGYQHA